MIRIFLIGIITAICIFFLSLFVYAKTQIIKANNDAIKVVGGFYEQNL